jgi:hypothetical protein
MIPDEVLFQLHLVQETGATNMHNSEGVHYVAEQCGLTELCEWIDDHRQGGTRIDGEVYMKALKLMGRKHVAEDLIDLDAGGRIDIDQI